MTSALDVVKLMKLFAVKYLMMWLNRAALYSAVYRNACLLSSSSISYLLSMNKSTDQIIFLLPVLWVCSRAFIVIFSWAVREKDHTGEYSADSSLSHWIVDHWQKSEQDIVNYRNKRIISFAMSHIIRIVLWVLWP